MKKACFFIVLLGFSLLGTRTVGAAGDYYVSNYEIIDLDFLRSHYTQIENGRPIQFDAKFSSYKWLSLYGFKERLAGVGLGIDRYNILQMTLMEKDGFHYSFPVLLVQTSAGDLKELNRLKPGERVKIYGKFYNLKKSEYAVETDLIETIHKGGHERAVLLDARVPLTPTPTPTVTPTPGPTLWQKVNLMINPKETPSPTGTITPGTN